MKNAFNQIFHPVKSIPKDVRQYVDKYDLYEIQKWFPRCMVFFSVSILSRYDFRVVINVDPEINVTDLLGRFIYKMERKYRVIFPCKQRAPVIIGKRTDTGLLLPCHKFLADICFSSYPKEEYFYTDSAEYVIDEDNQLRRSVLYQYCRQIAIPELLGYLHTIRYNKTNREKQEREQEYAKVIKKFVEENQTKEKRAVDAIEKWWYNAYYNPRHWYCQRRLEREYEALDDCMKKI